MEAFGLFASSNRIEFDNLNSIAVLKLGTKTEHVYNGDNVKLRTLIKSFLAPKCLKTFDGDSEGIFDSPADMAKAVIKILQNNNVRFTKEDGEPETNEKNIIVFVSQMMYGQCRKIKKNRAREQQQQQQPVHQQNPYCIPVQQQPFQYIQHHQPIHHPNIQHHHPNHHPNNFANNCFPVANQPTNHPYGAHPPAVINNNYYYMHPNHAHAPAAQAHQATLPHFGTWMDPLQLGPDLDDFLSDTL